MSAPSISYDPLLFGASEEEGIVAVEHVRGTDGDEMVIFIREDGALRQHREPFYPLLVAAA